MENVSVVFERIGVLGMSTVISGRVGRGASCSRPGALLEDEDAMFNRQFVVSSNVQQTKYR